MVVFTKDESAPESTKMRVRWPYTKPQNCNNLVCGLVQGSPGASDSGNRSSIVDAIAVACRLRRPRRLRRRTKQSLHGARGSADPPIERGKRCRSFRCPHTEHATEVDATVGGSGSVVRAGRGSAVTFCTRSIQAQSTGPAVSQTPAVELNSTKPASRA